MELVFQADSALEAHMIADLLNQQNIYTRIDGEALTGGIGEAQALGLVRVYVNADDHERAMQIVKEWDDKQPEPAEQAKVDVHRNSSFRYAFIFGFIVGVVMTLILVR